MTQHSIIIQLSNQNESEEALEKQTRTLISDFRTLEDVTVHIPKMPTIPGSRGDPITIGTIVLAFVTGGGVSAVVQILADWVKRGDNRKVVLKVSVDGNIFETEFPSQKVTEKEIIELTEKIKELLVSNKKRKG